VADLHHFGLRWDAISTRVQRVLQ